MDISRLCRRRAGSPTSTNESLAAIYAHLERIAAEPKRTEKSNLIKEGLDIPNFRKAVTYALDPFRMFGLSGLHTYSQSDQENTTDFAGYKYKVRSIENLFNKLDDLAASAGASHYDKRELSFLAAFDKESMKVVNRILKKDLRCGAGLRTFIRHIPELPLHEVMLCDSDFAKFKEACGDDPTRAAVSRKLDGVRTWAVMPAHDQTNGAIKYMSRNGMTYENFDCFTSSLLPLAEHVRTLLPGKASRLIFDGEAISKSRNFDSFCGKARSKQAVDVSDFIYYVFDFVAEDENGQLFPLTYTEREAALAAAFDNTDRPTANVEMHATRQLETWEEVPDLLAASLAAGEEGLVLKRVDSPYKFGRSRDWCKIKNRTFTENTMDLHVVGKVAGTGAFSDMLGALVVKYGDAKVKVGSGYTVEQREMYWKTPPRMIEVAYQDITKEGSLRFPIFIKVRDDKYEPEYE